MAKTYRQYLDNPVADKVQEVGAELLSQQGFWGRRKNSLTSAAQVVAQLANILLYIQMDVPIWVTITIAGLVGLAEIIIQAGTKGSVAPSVVAEIAGRVERVYEEPADIQIEYPDRSNVVSYSDNIGVGKHRAPDPDLDTEEPEGKPPFSVL